MYFAHARVFFTKYSLKQISNNWTVCKYRIHYLYYNNIMLFDVYPHGYTLLDKPPLSTWTFAAETDEQWPYSYNL